MPSRVPGTGHSSEQDQSGARPLSSQGLQWAEADLTSEPQETQAVFVLAGECVLAARDLAEPDSEESAMQRRFLELWAG